MSNKKQLSVELKNAIVWLERQPGVDAVVQGRFTRAKHHHKPGWARVSATDDRSVHLRAYDKLGVKDLFVHAKKSSARDAWVAALSGGDVLGPNGSGPRIVKAGKTTETARPSSATALPQHGPAQPKSLVLDADAAQLYDVTPDLAAKWLEHNTRNRALRNDTVLKYAADMKAGRWMVTGDAISFDTGGAVINGQHRLWAVLEAGVPVPMMVAFGLNPDVVRVLDDHLRRSLVDVAKITRPGVYVGTKQASIARMLLASSKKASLDRTLAANLPRQDQLDFMTRHWEAIEFATREVFRNKNVKAIAHTAVMVPVARAFYSQDRNRLTQFGKVMLSGMPEDAGDRGAIVLRNWLMKLTGTGMRADREIIYRKAENALWMFLRSEEMTKLTEAGKELFLLPEEQAGVKAAGRSRK